MKYLYEGTVSLGVWVGSSVNCAFWECFGVSCLPLSGFFVSPTVEASWKCIIKFYVDLSNFIH